MIPKFRGLSIDENSKGEWQYGHLIEDRGRAFIINKVADIFENIQRGISELEQHPEKYVQYEPENKWGTVSSALEDLRSLRDCILEQDIDTKYLYMRW